LPVASEKLKGMSELSFEIITPDGLKFQANVYEVIVPTQAGYRGILPHHIPLLGLVSPGVITIRHRADDAEDARESLATAGGFMEVDGRRVRLLADTAERAEDIDELKAQEAFTRAQELRRAAKDQVALADAIGLIERQAARLKVAELKRRRRPR